jgi:sugar lactone lactonase YvrE
MRQLAACAFIGAMITVLCAQTDPTRYAFSTFAGRSNTPGSVDGASSDARFNRPWGLAVDVNGNVYVADAGNFTVRKITPRGVVSTIAGQPNTTGTRDGPVATAQFGTLPDRGSSIIAAGPFGLAIEATGNVFVADSFSHTIRVVSPTAVSTFSGAANVSGFVDGAVMNARFNMPWGIAMDASGVTYVADTFNHVIRRISTNGVITTIAGTVGVWGSADGVGVAARFLNPTAIAVDPSNSGRLYVTDSNNTVRRVSRSATLNDVWEVATLAGSAGTFGSADGVEAAARFGGAPSVSSTTGGTTVRSPIPTPVPAVNIGVSYALDDLPGIAVDVAGNVFVTDHGNDLIRMITPAGVVTTIGGSNVTGSVDGIGASARFARPIGIAVDAAGNLYVADSLAHIIRKGSVAAAPAIEIPPTSQTVGVGATVELTVAATGAPTPTYQWTRNGLIVANATAATLTLPNIQSAQAGTYAVLVRNSLGAITSTSAIVEVLNTPVLHLQPLDQSVTAGGTVTLTVGAGGQPPLTLQWYRNGVPIPSQTNASIVLSNVQGSTAGDYFVIATNALGSATSNVARVTLSTARIVNLSIRTPLAGAEPLIVGFVATGGPKPLLIRAVGPTLRSFGVTGAMTDPQLSLQTAGVVAGTNDNWSSGSAVGQLTLAATQVGAFALPAESLDSAILATAVENAMTAQASSRNNAGGIVLVELYDTTPTGPSRLINVSARARVGGGENALFAGFVVSGSGSKTLLIRAIGPTLGAFGVSGVLADPRLDIFVSGASAPMASNDNWGGNGVLAAAFRSVAAFSLPANDSKDAALLVLLPPGAYSAQVTGVGGLTGEVLLEIYELP